jgi:hypothetical protein
VFTGGETLCFEEFGAEVFHLFWAEQLEARSPSNSQASQRQPSFLHPSSSLGLDQQQTHLRPGTWLGFNPTPPTPSHTHLIHCDVCLWRSLHMKSCTLISDCFVEVCCLCSYSFQWKFSIHQGQILLFTCFFVLLFFLRVLSLLKSLRPSSKGFLLKLWLPCQRCVFIFLTGTLWY